jgi:allantoin racemase
LLRLTPRRWDTFHDWLLADVGVLEAGLSARRNGYDAVCIDTMTDSGLNALRSVLEIPVLAAGKASYLTALALGNRFSILSQWEPLHAAYEKCLAEYGLADKCASIRSVNEPLDVEDLLAAKLDQVLPRLLEQAKRCVEDDGADVVCLGSTGLHQAHAYLAERLPVPVINPGPVLYRLALLLAELQLTHSARAYRRAEEPELEVLTRLAAARPGSQP